MANREPKLQSSAQQKMHLDGAYICMWSPWYSLHANNARADESTNPFSLWKYLYVSTCADEMNE